jgi:hypothetical protein
MLAPLCANCQQTQQFRASTTLNALPLSNMVEIRKLDSTRATKEIPDAF